MTKRRDFLKKASAAIAGSMLLQGCRAGSTSGEESSLKKIGIQLFSVPKMLEKDFAETMRMISHIGYKEIEFFGPYSFSAPEDIERWKTVTPSLGFSGSGYFGLSVNEVKNILDDLGLSTPSMHTGLLTLKQQMGRMAEAAHVLGTKYVILPSAASQPDLDGYKKQADEFNEIGLMAEREGLRFAYHNHGNGLKPIQGVVPFELIMERTDPKRVFFQMDIFWTAAGGIDPVTYLDKYPGRFRLMHIKDMSQKARFSGDGGDPAQWIELFPFLTDAGKGVLDIKNIISHAVRSGVEHFIVERDLAPDPEASLTNAYNYLSKLELEK
jgi:sugar phosphate isomerase/epimerase